MSTPGVAGVFRISSTPARTELESTFAWFASSMPMEVTWTT
ncbi:MAG: hypothetical protein V5A62_14890 [Haloarculaceae archaeon]